MFLIVIVLFIIQYIQLLAAVSCIKKTIILILKSSSIILLILCYNDYNINVIHILIESSKGEPKMFTDFENQKKEKPDCPLIGQNGNIYNLLGIASDTLKKAGMTSEAKEMCKRVLNSHSYEQALAIIGLYVHITSINDED